VPTVSIEEQLWKDLVKLARERKRSPEVLTEHALRDFIQREADEVTRRVSSRVSASDRPKK
jgi:predicted transcriptional regulator